MSWKIRFRLPPVPKAQTDTAMPAHRVMKSSMMYNVIVISIHIKKAEPPELQAALPAFNIQ